MQQRSRSFIDLYFDSFKLSGLLKIFDEFDLCPVYSGEQFRASWPSCFFKKKRKKEKIGYVVLIFTVSSII